MGKMYTKKELDTLFNRQVDKKEGLEILDVRSGYGYFDEERNVERIYHDPDNAKTLTDRILMDKEVGEIIDREALALYLETYADPNSLMVLNQLALVWDPDDEEDETACSPVRKQLYDLTWDEYVYEVGCGEMLGITWVERQIVVINVRAIIQTALEVEEESLFANAEKDFAMGLCSTIFHELRHLFYECNEIVPTGEGTEYPEDGGEEEDVEDYGNLMMENYFFQFTNFVFKDYDNFKLKPETSITIDAVKTGLEKGCIWLDIGPDDGKVVCRIGEKNGESYWFYFSEVASEYDDVRKYRQEHDITEISYCILEALEEIRGELDENEYGYYCAVLQENGCM